MLHALERRADGYMLPYRTVGSAWRHMQALCRAAGVTPKGVHALRHAAGTRLYAETRDLEATARHLGHCKLETTRIYAKWSDRQLRETIGRWWEPSRRVPPRLYGHAWLGRHVAYVLPADRLY